MKKFLTLSLFALMIVALAACGSEESSGKDSGATFSADRLVVGGTSGPHEDMLERGQELRKEGGSDTEVKVFRDYVMPNVAVADSVADNDRRQTEAFCDQMKEERGVDLVKVADTGTLPVGMYAEDVTDVN